MVVIHHTVPSEDDPPSPTHCYRPLSPENALAIPKTHSHRPLSPEIRLATTSPKKHPKKPVPILPAPEPVILHTAPVVTSQQVITSPQVVVPCYTTQPIVYVVQVPGAGPTPPTSECSSDVENVQLCTVERLGEPLDVGQKDDIIILPLSPEPDSHTGLEQTVVPESSTKKMENMVTSSNISLPDRRKKKNRRGKGSNINNNDHSVEDMDCDVEVVQVSPVSKTVRISRISSVYLNIVLKI